MRNCCALAILALLLLGSGIASAWADFQGPFCLQVGPPLSNRLVIRVDFVTPTQFQIIGYVFGEESLFGSGLLSGTQVRFALASGPRGGPTIALPLFVTGILSLG